MNTKRALIVAVIAVCVALSTQSHAQDQQAFSLTTGQAVMVSGYALSYTGLTAAGWPSYQLTGGGGVMMLPSGQLPSSCCDYHQGNVSVVTTGIAPDGSAVAGIVTVR